MIQIRNKSAYPSPVFWSRQKSHIFTIPRAALKSGNLPGQAADDPIHAAAHFFLEGGTSAVARLALAAGPSPVLSLHRASQDAQHGNRAAATRVVKQRS